MHIGVIRENRNHIIVILCRMHPDPRHHIQSRSSVLVERLMIMPDKRHIQRLILACRQSGRQPHHNCHKEHKCRSSHNPSFHGLALPPYIFALQAHPPAASLRYPLAAHLCYPLAAGLRSLLSNTPTLFPSSEPELPPGSKPTLFPGSKPVLSPGGKSRSLLSSMPALFASSKPTLSTSSEHGLPPNSTTPQ